MIFSDKELLLFSCATIALVSLLGGLIPRLVKITHIRLQLSMSLVAGFMAGVAILHLLPHSISLSVDKNAAEVATFWTMLGLVIMFVMIRSFHFHQHEQPLIVAPCSQQDSSQAESFLSCGWIGVVIGFSIHSFIEGAALVASLRLELSGKGDFPWVWFGVLMAILLHKPLDSMSISFLMKSSRLNSFTNNFVNILFAMMCPIGALTFYFGVENFLNFNLEILSAVIAFCAGAFICIALSDLLPEVHQHTHDRFTLTLMFLIGVLFSYLLRILEGNTGLVGHI